MDSITEDPNQQKPRKHNNHALSTWLTSIVAIATVLLITWGIVIAGSTAGAQVAGRSVFFWCAVVAFCIQWGMFTHAWLQKSEALFDLTGSITHVLVILMGLVFAQQRDVGAIVLALLVVIWAGRLGPFLYHRIRQAGEDRRFKSIRHSFPRFLMTWTLQGAWVFLTLCCALAAITSSVPVPIGVSFWVGLVMWCVGFTIEVVADRQKSSFRADPANAQRFITTGLWAWSRHPNYFGEILLWCGVAVIAYPALVGAQAYTLISPLFVTFLLVFVSGVRMLEGRADKQWGDDEAYQRYKRQTPALMLWPPRKAS